MSTVGQLSRLKDTLELIVIQSDLSFKIADLSEAKPKIITCNLYDASSATVIRHMHMHEVQTTNNKPTYGCLNDNEVNDNFYRHCVIRSTQPKGKTLTACYLNTRKLHITVS